MFVDPDGPIESYDWGRFQINGEYHSENGEGVGKDICILEGNVTPWKARKGHRLKPEMVACVLDRNVSVLVIGIGARGALRVLKKTRMAIKAAGIKNVLIEKTPEACAAYNKLAREGKRVALLAHGTC